MRLKVLATGTIGLALLVGAGYLPGYGNWPATAATLVLLAAFSIGWPRLLRASSPNPLSAVIFAVSAAAALFAATSGAQPTLGAVAPAVAAGVLLVFLTQLMRGTNASKRLESVAVGITGMLVAAFGSGWAALGAGESWRAGALVAGIGILAAAAPGVLRLPDRIVFPLGFVLAVLAGGAASLLHPGIELVPALVIGAACGLVVVGSRAMLVSLGGPRNPVQLLGAALAPLLVCGSVTWYVLLVLA